MAAGNRATRVTVVAGDRTRLGVQLTTNDGTPKSLSGITVTADVVDTVTGTTVVGDGTVVVDDEANGKLTWTPSATAFDEVGIYAIYFLTDESPVVRRPYDGARFLVRVVAPGNR